MSKIGGVSGDILRQHIERIERLEQEKMNIASDIRDLYASAKIDGFEPKIIRQIVKERKMKDQERDEQEILLETYKRALGMLPDFEEAA